MGDVSEDGDNRTSYNDGLYWGEFNIKLPRDAEALSAIAHERPGLIALPTRGEDLYLSLMNATASGARSRPGIPRALLGVRRGVLLPGRAAGGGNTARRATRGGVRRRRRRVPARQEHQDSAHPRQEDLPYPSVYLDQHGEEDEFLKRGRPLFLNERRYGALEDLWVNGALDYDTLALHTQQVGSDFY